MEWSPHVTVAAVVLHHDRYLMVEESPEDRSVINQPAGHLEHGETLLEAICREVLEETTRHFEPTGLIGVYQWSLPGTSKTYLRFCFSGAVGEPDPGRTRDPDIRATHWLSRPQITQGPWPLRSPMVVKCIDDLARRAPMSLDLLTALGPIEN